MYASVNGVRMSMRDEYRTKHSNFSEQHRDRRPRRENGKRKFATVTPLRARKGILAATWFVYYAREFEVAPWDRRYVIRILNEVSERPPRGGRSVWADLFFECPLLAQSRRATCGKALKPQRHSSHGVCTAQFSLAYLATEFREQDRMFASYHRLRPDPGVCDRETNCAPACNGRRAPSINPKTRRLN
jgi:hypothetical protein